MLLSVFWSLHLQNSGLYTNEQIAELFQIELSVVNQLLYTYHLSFGEPLMETLTLPAFINYLISDFAVKPIFEPLFASEVLAELQAVSFSMEAATEMLVSDNFSRMMINTTFEFESEETFAFIDQVRADLEVMLEGDFHILGTSVMPPEFCR